MVALIARASRVPLSYAGKRLAEGDAFNVTPAHARLLLALGKADLAPEDRDPVRVDPPREPTEGEAPKRKRGRPRKAPAEGAPKVRIEPAPEGGDVPAEIPAPPAPNDPPAQDEQAEGASPEDVSTGTENIDDAPAEEKPRRFFRRRDMRAED